MNESIKRYIVAKRRSEQGKLIRRLYKNDIGVPYQLCKGYSLMLDGYSNTVTTYTTDNWILELKNKKNMELTYHEHPTKEQLLEYFSQRIAIRKMTSKEAFRLMSVSDEDIEKIQAYPFKSYRDRAEAVAKADKKEQNRIKRESICKTAQYRLAGNSIVTNCLYWIFHKMFIDTSAPVQAQLTLFD